MQRISIPAGQHVISAGTARLSFVLQTVHFWRKRVANAEEESTLALDGRARVSELIASMQRISIPAGQHVISAGTALLLFISTGTALLLLYCEPSTLGENVW